MGNAERLDGKDGGLEICPVGERMGVRDIGYGAYILDYHLQGSKTICLPKNVGHF